MYVFQFGLFKIKNASSPNMKKYKQIAELVN